MNGRRHFLKQLAAIGALTLTPRLAAKVPPHSLDEWRHIAIVREKGNVRGYVDGIESDNLPFGVVSIQGSDLCVGNVTVQDVRPMLGNDDFTIEAWFCAEPLTEVDSFRVTTAARRFSDLKSRGLICH